MEGDSALGSCKLARDPMFQAIMPIRGKILNCLKADYPRIFKSDIITDLVKVLGCGVEIKSAHNKNIESLPISSHLNKLYNIQEIYKKLFEENTIKNFYDLSNPSSGGNPSSESFSSRFK